MALKNKAGAKAVKSRLRGDSKAGESGASKKAKATKASKKKTAKTRTSASKGNCEPGRQRKIRVSDAGEQNETVEVNLQELDPFEVAKQTMKGSVPAIVEAMVELAKKGSCSHAKTLLEMTGARHMFECEAEVQDDGEPWAKLILQRLGEVESVAGCGVVSGEEVTGN